MKVKKLNIYNQNPDKGVSNEYSTPPDAFRQPCLWYISAVRNSGKSYLCSKFLAQAKKDKTFHKIYMITPSFASNRSYFGKYVDEEDVFEPTKESISNVIERVEADRDEWEEYLEQKERYKDFVKMMKQKKPISHYNEDDLLMYYDMGFMEEPPKYKYNEPVKSLLILDDVINSPAILQSSGLGKLATLNRHIAPLKKEYNNRSACGLAVIILSQSYRCGSGQGIGRLIRENLSLFTLFENKQEKQMQAIEDEIGSVIDINKFREAYKIATKEKYGNLTIDFSAKCPSKIFRKNLNECIIFDDMECKCKK